MVIIQFLKFPVLPNC